MNAGGTTFWITLLVSVCLAAGSTWLFLSEAEDSSPVAPESALSDPNAATADVEVEPEEPASTEADVQADVTFSFAQEFARFGDGTYLEQDDLFKVTFRSAEGEALWTWEMDGPLLAAERPDANDDGPKEFLLVDSRQGVGLDPSGRPITGFKVKPSVPITSFAMVDYEGDGKERYLFGLADGRLLNHRNLGEATPGWRHSSKGSGVQAIAHLRAGRKDYVCTVDEAGVVMLLKRNGQRRLRTPVQLNRSAGARAVAFDVRADIGSSMIISRGEEGQIESRRFDDGVVRAASAAEQQLLETEEARLQAGE